jgi:hypothetical protein
VWPIYPSYNLLIDTRIGSASHVPVADSVRDDENPLLDNNEEMPNRRAPKLRLLLTKMMKKRVPLTRYKTLDQKSEPKIVAAAAVAAAATMRGQPESMDELDDSDEDPFKTPPSTPLRSRFFPSNDSPDNPNKNRFRSWRRREHSRMKSMQILGVEARAAIWRKEAL